jgi:hypothetical protein
MTSLGNSAGLAVTARKDTSHADGPPPRHLVPSDRHLK